jgi:hypothetical protein
MLTLPCSCRIEGTEEQEQGTTAPAPLINGLPYAMPAAVSLPRATEGCARTQPISGSKHIRDGTGVGNTTLSGWWIPTEADIPQNAHLAASAPFSQSNDCSENANAQSLSALSSVGG